jgi:ATP-dependent DNA ligase
MPRRDCKHIKLKKQDSGRVSGDHGGGTDYATDRVSAAANPAASAPTAKSALKAGASPEEAADVARVKREEVQAKKDKKLGKMRYGFQLAHTYEPVDLEHGEWVAEIKYDGELAMWIVGRIVNRSGNDVTHRFPEVHFGTDAVLVGELVIVDENDASHFNKIQERSTDDPIKIRALARMQPATFMAFDMLETPHGEDITACTFRERRLLMAEKVAFDGRNGRVRMVGQISIENDHDVQALVNECRKLETEGVMLKNVNAPYVARRGRSWLKAKTFQEREFNIVRFEDTGIGDGFVIYIVNKGREQRINCGSHQMRQKIRAGHKRVEIKFLSESEDGAMRFPSVLKLVS